jgi:micrococcal nuclease
MIYRYKAKIERIIDGDTLTTTLFLPFDILKFETVRLARINAPEKRGIEKPEGLISEKALDDWLIALNNTESRVEIETTKKGKYGRYIAEIWYRLNPENPLLNLSDEMVSAGYAEYKEY